MSAGKIIVYGAKVTCPSCVGAPSSLETYEWLQAATKRKYPDRELVFQYIDIFEEQLEEEHQLFIERVMEEDLFYPVVVIDEEIIAEGNILLKDIYYKIENE